MLEIQVMGPGCTKCNKLADSTREAAEALGLDYTLEKVTDLDRMLALGVMAPPALVVNGVVKVMGKAPDAKQISAILSEA